MRGWVCVLLGWLFTLLSLFSLTGSTFAEVRFLPEKGYCVDELGARSLGRGCIGACCDMAYRDLRSENLSGVDLRGANLYRANLRGVDFTGTNLERASLRESLLEGANLLQAHVKGTDFFGAQHSIATLLPFDDLTAESRGMRDVPLQNQQLVDVPAWSHDEIYFFDPGKKACVDVSGARGLNKGFFGECGDLAFEDLRGQEFRRGSFSGANFHQAIIEKADLTGANLEAAAISEEQIQASVNFESAYRGVGRSPEPVSSLFFSEQQPLPGLRGIQWKINDPQVLNFLRDTEGYLPRKMRETLAVVPVEFRDLDRKGPIEPVSCGPDTSADEARAFGERIFGRYQDGTVFLHSELLAHIRRGSANAKPILCGPGRIFKNMYRFAQAKLVHELGHFYDSKTDFSEDPRFRNLRQWTRTAILGRDDQKNAQMLRSPNAYEYKDPGETFAVNLEYFLLDPEYACHRPSTNFALTEEMKGVPPIQRLNKPCALLDDVVLRSPRYPEKAIPFRLQPERLFEAHYFIASKGEETGSGFGHSMLRLIFCAPERATVGADCLRDHSYHVVVSFRANVFDMALDSWKGLAGLYPSQMFLFEMNDTVDDYTKAEFRDIISVPLKLSPSERQHLVLHILELYWEYLGRYYFLANNCATETLDLIKAVVPDRRTQEISSISPFGVYEGLVDAGLLNDTVIRNPSYAIRSGSYFRSQERVYEGAFALLKKLDSDIHNIRWKSYQEYTTASTAAERRSLYERFKEKRKTAFPHIDLNLITGNFALLESRVLEVWRQWFLKEMFARLDSGLIPSEFEEKLKLLAFESAAAVQPARPGLGGYGIPLPSEISGSSLAESKVRLDEATKDLRQWFAREFASELFELSETDRNLSQFKRWIVVD